MSTEFHMVCAEALRGQSYFDGQLDASASVDIERHLAACDECAALLQDLQTIRDDVRVQGRYYRASPALKTRLAELLDRESGSPRKVVTFIPRGKQFWSGAMSGAGATALAAALALLVLAPGLGRPDHLVDDLMGAHVRSLMENHLIDVVSSDQHTVKPWFAGHADVSPPAVDFPREDYRLVGGRVDYIDGQRAAVVVYRHGAHIINVFAWNQRDGSLPNIVTRQGYHIVFWRNGNLIFCAVSDTALDEITGLTRLLQAASTPETK
jgi:anti-sigma factor RsiW